MMILKKKKYNIAIIGLGNIGLNLYKHLIKNRQNIKKKTNIDFQIIYVSAKNRLKKRSVKIPKKLWIKNYIQAARGNNIDIVIEPVPTFKFPAPVIYLFPDPVLLAEPWFASKIRSPLAVVIF